MSSQAAQLDVATEQPIALNPENPRERELMLVEREFGLLQRKAKALSASNIIPKEYQNNIPNCMIAMEMANRLNTGELEIMQNLYVVHGKPGFSAAYLIARINNSQVLHGRLRFTFVGERGSSNYGCFAYGIDAQTQEELKGTLITMAMADAEGWTKKNGSKWKTMPDQMLMYRAASFWSRTYAPDATMGMQTVEEVREIQEIEINPAPQTDLSSVQDMLDGGKVDAQTGEVIDMKPHEDAEATAFTAFNRLEEMIAMAVTSNDLDAIIALPDWAELEDGEPQQLHVIIDAKRNEMTDPA